MKPPREPSVILAAWLEEGPTDLPESTRRAIAVDVRTTRQARRSRWMRWRFPTVDRLSLVAVTAAAAVVLAVAGLAVSLIDPSGGNVGGPPSAPSPSPSPSSSVTPSVSPPNPTTIGIPAMTESYVSGRYGYSIMYPADWSPTEATQPWSPPDWRAAGSPTAPFDFIGSDADPSALRAASAPLPEGLPNVSDWIDQYLTFGDPRCVPPREAQELISIDGAPGRLRDRCGEVEATIILEGRVYMFTLFLGSSQDAYGRELFDAFAATIDLRPKDAALPSQRP